MAKWVIPNVATPKDHNLLITASIAKEVHYQSAIIHRSKSNGVWDLESLTSKNHR